MATLPLPFRLITLLLITATFTVSAEENFADTLDEAFIEFRFLRTGDSFYRVMMDYDETPYLNIEEILSKWLEMEVECQVERLYCQGIMIHNGKGFWVDGQQMLFGHSNSNSPSDQPLPENSLLVKEDQLWLRWDVWDEWFPMSIAWSLEQYTISFQPHFPLKKERKKIREKARLAQWQKQRNLERLAKIPPIQPTEPYRSEMRYNIAAVRSSDDTSSINMNYDVGTDIWQGHFEFSGNASDENNRFNPINYWRFQQIDRPYFYLLEIGDTRFDSTLLAPGLGITNGVRLDKSERVKGSGSFEFNSRTEPNTEIELTINGFIQETLYSDDNGDFSISRRLVASGDRISLKFYFEDGTEDERIIIIASDNSMIVKKNQWDAAMIMGDTVLGPYAHLESRYGVWDDYSMGMHLYQIPHTNTLNDTQDQKLIPSIDMGWRPIPGLAFLVELAQEKESLNYSFRSDIGMWRNHHIQLESQSISDKSVFLTSTLFTYDIPSYHRLQYSLRFAPWSILTRFTQSSNSQIVSLDIDRRFSRRFNMNANLESIESDDTDTVLNGILSGTYTPSDKTIYEFSRNQGEDTGSWSFRFRYTGKTKNPWSKKASDFPWRANLVGSILDDDENNFALNVTWHNNRYLSSSFQVDKNNILLSLIWRDAYSVGKEEGQWKWKRHNWNHYATGTVEGYVMTPALPDSSPEPLGGVELRAAGQKAVTDETGFYRLSGMPVNSRVLIKVNKNTLDASMVPLNEDVVAVFRPSTQVKYDPEITWTAGLDGLILTNNSIPAGATVEVYREGETASVSTAPLEDDGFFLVEGLTPNRYTIRIIGVDNPPPTKVVEIPPGTDWLGGVEIEWMTNSTQSEDKLQENEEDNEVETE